MSITPRDCGAIYQDGRAGSSYTVYFMLVQHGRFQYALIGLHNGNRKSDDKPIEEQLKGMVKVSDPIPHETWYEAFK